MYMSHSSHVDNFDMSEKKIEKEKEKKNCVEVSNHFFSFYCNLFFLF